MVEDRLIGTDVNALLHAKKQSRLFSRSQSADKTGVGLFLAQLFGWSIFKVLGVVSLLLTGFLAIEKALINLRVDTLQLFYWGRGNIFALFFQAVAFFVVLAVGFSLAVSQGIQGRIIGQYTPTSPVVVYAAASDTVVESGSLITSMPKELKRIETIDYIVSYDDTLGGKTLDNIAIDFEITADSIRWANNFSKTHQPKPGTKIKIPPLSGSLYTVQDGDTIESLSSRFKIDRATLIETNFLDAPYKIKTGQALFLVNTAPVAPIVKKKTTTKRSLLIYGTGGGFFTPPSGTRFLGWPVPSSSSISRCWLGYYVHDGIDIYAPNGGHPRIVAAAAGRVTAAGFKCDARNCGFAWRVEIDHGNGYSTLYGHLNGGSGVGIAEGLGIGDTVEKGQLIGYMGSSGWSTGTHLHFKLSYKGTAVNPAPYMTDSKSCR